MVNQSKGRVTRRHTAWFGHPIRPVPSRHTPYLQTDVSNSRTVVLWEGGGFDKFGLIPYRKL